MKKTLLSIMALVAVVFMVACNGNAKVVDAQVKAIETISARIDSIQTMDQLNAVADELSVSLTTFAETTKDLQLSEEEQQKLSAAQEAFVAKFTPVSEKLQLEAQAVLEAEAAAAALVEAEAAKTKKK